MPIATSRRQTTVRAVRTSARVLALAGLVLATGLAALPAGHAEPRTGPAGRPAGLAGIPAGPGSAPVVVDDGAGRTRLVGARPGRTLSAAPADARGPAQAARAQLAAHLPAFGLRDTAGLRTVASRSLVGGQTAVRFRQVADGVPVLGGELVTVLGPDRSLLAVSGEVSRDVSPWSARVAASRAARVALAATARAHRLPDRLLRAARPTRALHDAALLDPRGARGARPVWRVEVRAADRLDVRELVLVDARTGVVRLQVDQVAHALDRVVCDDVGVSSSDGTCGPGEYDRVEGQPATGVRDVDEVYDLTGATATWFAERLGVDLTALIGSDRGDGRKLRSTTRYCGPEGCPLNNAFWTGEEMVYGEGFTSADDVVAHELVHGVTQQTSGLVYWFQSGAINESMSDVFGELVDLADGVGDDRPEVRWLLGEDLSVQAGGPARHMADPPRFGQPDHTGSDLYDFAPGYDDSGGVHTNSGVPNKAAYLVADGTAGEPGGVFNGRAVAGIGVEKTGLLYWSTLQTLTPGADFADLAAVLAQTCRNLAGSGTGGFVTADCTSVADAAAATGLSRWAGPTVPRRVRAETGTGSVRLTWRRPAAEGSSPLTSFVVWVRPGAGGEDFVALEPGARSHVLTGLPPGVDHRVGVLAVTADGSSPPVTRLLRGSRLEVSWPEAVVVGDRPRVRGVLTGGSGPQAGRAVTLVRTDGRQRPVTSATSRADGSFSLALPATRTASYAVVAAPDGLALGARTAERRVPVRSRVTLRVDAGLQAGAPARFRGVVTPPRPGADVRLQHRPAGGGGWSTRSRGRLDAAGRYDLRPGAGAPVDGEWRVRVARDRQAGLAPGLSRVVRPPTS